MLWRLVLPPRRGGCTRHEIPGGQLSNLRQQAIALGLGDRFEAIEANYAAADRVLGRLVKVTPSSKVVGDLALGPGRRGHIRRRIRLGPSAIRHSRLGDRLPARRAWRPARRLAGTVADQGAGRAPTGQTHRGASPDDEVVLAQAGPKRQAVAEPAAVPRADKGIRGAPRNLWRHLQRCRPTSSSTGCGQGEEHRVRLERGVELLIGLEAISDADERGMRTVMCILNGQLRPVVVRDRNIASEVPDRGEGRPDEPRPCRRAVRRRRHRQRERGRRGRRRTDNRHHRGDEDGGRHHRAQGRQGRTASPYRPPHRSRAATCWWWSADPHRRRHVRRPANRGAAHRNSSDHRSGARVVVQRARRADRLRRGGGARPVRGIRSARPRGALTRRGVGAVRRGRPARRRRHRQEHRVSRREGATVRRGAVAAVLAGGRRPAGAPGACRSALRRRPPARSRRCSPP